MSREPTVLSREVYAEVIGPPTDDPYATFARWRSETPTRAGDVMTEINGKTLTPTSDKPKFSLLRYEDISRALREPETFSSDVYFESLEYLPGSSTPIVAMRSGSDEHRFWRGIYTALFSRKAILVWEDEIFIPVAQRLAKEIAASGKKADLVDFAMQFPTYMIYGLFGIDAEDDVGFEWFQEHALEAATGFAVSLDAERTRRNREKSLRALVEVVEVLERNVRRKRAAGAPGNDLISRMIRAESDGRGADDRLIAESVTRSLPAATENTWRQFLNTMTCLLVRPELVDEVRADRELVPLVISEGERYESAMMAIPRSTTTEIELNGTTIPAGAYITLVLGAGNRDAEAYAGSGHVRHPPPRAASAHVRLRRAYLSRLEHRTVRDEGGAERIARPSPEPAARPGPGATACRRCSVPRPALGSGHLGLIPTRGTTHRSQRTPG